MFICPEDENAYSPLLFPALTKGHVFPLKLLTFLEEGGEGGRDKTKQVSE